MPVTKVMILEALANKLQAKKELQLAWSIVEQAHQELENTMAMPGHPADIAYAKAAIATAMVDQDLARTYYQKTALIYTALIQQRQKEKEVGTDGKRN